MAERKRRQTKEEIDDLEDQIRFENFDAPEPSDGEWCDFYTWSTGGRTIIVSDDPCATSRGLRQLEIETASDPAFQTRNNQTVGEWLD